MTRDEKNVLHNQTIYRLYKNGVDVTNSVDVVVALQNEIDIYREEIEREREINGDLREKINHMERVFAAQNRIVSKLKICSCTNDPTTCEAVQENTTAEIIKALADNGYNTITINCYKDIERG